MVLCRVNSNKHMNSDYFIDSSNHFNDVIFDSWKKGKQMVIKKNHHNNQCKNSRSSLKFACFLFKGDMLIKCKLLLVFIFPISRTTKFDWCINFRPKISISWFHQCKLTVHGWMEWNVFLSFLFIRLLPRKIDLAMSIHPFMKYMRISMQLKSKLIWRIVWYEYSILVRTILCHSYDCSILSSQPHISKSSLDFLFFVCYITANADINLISCSICLCGVQ